MGWIVRGDEGLTRDVAVQGRVTQAPPSHEQHRREQRRDLSAACVAWPRQGLSSARAAPNTMAQITDAGPAWCGTHLASGSPL